MAHRGEKRGEDDGDAANPFAGLEKSRVLQEVRR